VRLPPPGCQPCLTPPAPVPASGPRPSLCPGDTYAADRRTKQIAVGGDCVPRATNFRRSGGPAPLRRAAGKEATRTFRFALGDLPRLHLLALDSAHHEASFESWNASAATSRPKWTLRASCFSGSTGFQRSGEPTRTLPERVLAPSQQGVEQRADELARILFS
jgi:hypothetical protein